MTTHKAEKVDALMIAILIISVGDRALFTLRWISVVAPSML